MEKRSEGNGVDRLVRITRYFFKSPPEKHLFFAIILAALLFTVAGNDLLSKTGYAIFLIVPALLTSVLAWRVVKFLGGYFKSNHSFFISTVSMLGIAVTLAIVSLIERFYVFKNWNSLEILFVALAAVFMLQLLVFAAVGGLSLHRAVLPSSLYVLFSAIILYSFRVVAAKTLVRFALLIFASFAIVWIYIKLIDAPFKRTLGISTFNLISLAVREYVNPASSNMNPFAGSGKETRVPFQALRFDSGSEKYLLAVPWLHPGPVESMGGRLPAALSENAREDFNGCVFMHTYVDHSLNPIFAEDTAKELSRLCKNKNLYGKPSAKATQFVEIRKSNVNVIAQKIGDLYIFITSFAPEITEDVSSAIGFNLLDKYKNRAIFIDAHNSFSPDSENEEPVNFGDSKAGRLFSAIDFAKENVDAKKQSAVEFSVEATQKDFMTEGIRSVSVIAYRIAGQKTAIVVLDTNNLVPSFRERIRNRLKSAGFGIVELVTTDAHLVEFLVKKHDQIGLRNTESLEEEIIALAKKALAKLHSAKAAYIFTDLKARVFGEGLFPQIIATGNSLIPFAKFTATALFMAFLFASYLLLQL